MGVVWNREDKHMVLGSFKSATFTLEFDPGTGLWFLTTKGLDEEKQETLSSFREAMLSIDLACETDRQQVRPRSRRGSQNQQPVEIVGAESHKIQSRGRGRVDVEIHPVANVIPEMSGEEFLALKADIERNGQLEPIAICNVRRAR